MEERKRKLYTASFHLFFAAAPDTRGLEMFRKRICNGKE